MSSDPWSIFDSEQNKLSHNCLSQDLSTLLCVCTALLVEFVSAL
jgi:hypothetical protein